MNKVVTEIEIFVSGSVVIQLRESDIEAIAKNGGDYASYIENMPYSRSYAELSEGSRDYSPSAVENALAEYLKKRPSQQENCPVFSTYAQIFMSESEIGRGHFELRIKGLASVEIDRDVLGNICPFADTKHPMNELNYVYFDEDNIVATDTRKLIVSPNTTTLNNAYLPKSFCEVYSSDIHSKLYVKRLSENTEEIYLCTGDKTYCHIIEKKHTWRYIDYNRGIPSKFNVELPPEDFLQRHFLLDGFPNISVLHLKTNSLDSFVFFDSFVSLDESMSFCLNSETNIFCMTNDKYKHIGISLFPSDIKDEYVSVATKMATERGLI